jgi:ubiquinone biosynthesis accessory factor UbiK
MAGITILCSLLPKQQHKHCIRNCFTRTITDIDYLAIKRIQIMLSKKFFDDISDKLNDTISNSPIKDMEKNVKSMLGSAFSRMDLITREEFDIQQQVLLKTREKLAELETRVIALEALLAQNSNGSNNSPASAATDNHTDSPA